MTYPMKGYSPVKLYYEVGGSGSNQMEGPDNYHQAWQSQNIEFIASHHAWWEDTQPYCDIVMPTNHIGEREDLFTFNEYAIFGHKLIEPLYESMTDMEVVMGLAQRLGVSNQVFQGMTVDQWLQSLYASAKMPLSFDDFKAQGFIKFATTPADMTTTSVGALQGFHDDPVKNPLATPTGKIELYSTAIAGFYGLDGKTMPAHTAYPANPIAPVVPMYIPATENKNSALAQKYPLLQTGGGQKFGRHSQWNNMAWLRDDEQTFLNGYRVIIMSNQDANARGLKYGDVVRVFNDRGQILCAAKPTERILPGVVWIFEGGHIKQQQPGVIGSLDMGGNHANLTITWQAEPICDGIATHSGLVQVEKYKG
jgi:anaerobic selenocysteine-containing dehydrogenase